MLHRSCPRFGGGLPSDVAQIQLAHQLPGRRGARRGFSARFLSGGSRRASRTSSRALICQQHHGLTQTHRRTVRGPLTFSLSISGQAAASAGHSGPGRHECRGRQSSAGELEHREHRGRRGSRGRRRGSREKTARGGGLGEGGGGGGGSRVSLEAREGGWSNSRCNAREHVHAPRLLTPLTLRCVGRQRIR